MPQPHTASTRTLSGINATDAPYTGEDAGQCLGLGARVCVLERVSVCGCKCVYMCAHVIRLHGLRGITDFMMDHNLVVYL